MPAPTKKKAMPAKKVVAKPAAKVVAKAPVKKVAARPAAPARARVARKSEDLWTKQFFGKEQDDFYAAHPNSRVLIALFTGALVLFMYIVWSNKLDLFPQAFMW
jgi:hypothetical protein